jgi:hypothetical protein
VPHAVPQAAADEFHVGLYQVERRRPPVQEPATSRYRAQPGFTVVPLDIVLICPPHGQHLAEEWHFWHGYRRNAGRYIAYRPYWHRFANIESNS